MLRTILKPLSFLPALIMMYIIFSFSAQEGDVSSQLSYQASVKIVETADYIFNADLDYYQIDEWANKIDFITRKLAHMTEYFALAIAVSFPLYVYGMHGILLMLFAGLICVGFACGDEYHQSFVAGRSPSARDICIDSVGVFLGIIVVRIIGWTGRKTIFRPKKKKQKRKLFGRKAKTSYYEYDGYDNRYHQPMTDDRYYQQPSRENDKYYREPPRQNDKYYREPSHDNHDYYQASPPEDSRYYPHRPSYDQRDYYRQAPSDERDYYRQAPSDEHDYYRQAPSGERDYYRQAPSGERDYYRQAPSDERDYYRETPSDNRNYYRQNPQKEHESYFENTSSSGNTRTWSKADVEAGLHASSPETQKPATSTRKVTDPNDPFWSPEQEIDFNSRPEYPERHYQGTDDPYDHDWGFDQEENISSDSQLAPKAEIPVEPSPATPNTTQEMPLQTPPQSQHRRKKKHEKDWFFDL